MDADVSATNVGASSQKAKPAGILTGLFTGNPSGLAKGKVSVLEYFSLQPLQIGRRNFLP